MFQAIISSTEDILDEETSNMCIAGNAKEAASDKKLKATKSLML